MISKYAPNTEKIILKVESLGEQVKVSVIDFGFGIPKDKQQNLFQKFSRIDNVDYQISGLGIGLFLSQEIISRHGGTIGVESEAGQGSTFSFTLPVGAG